MADIRKYLFARHLRSDANVHVTRFRNGRAVRDGRGLTFWFLPQRASMPNCRWTIATWSCSSKAARKDFQEVTVQGNLTWRVADPAVLGNRIDFSIDLKAAGTPPSRWSRSKRCSPA